MKPQSGGHYLDSDASYSRKKGVTTFEGRLQTPELLLPTPKVQSVYFLFPLGNAPYYESQPLPLDLCFLVGKVTH